MPYFSGKRSTSADARSYSPIVPMSNQSASLWKAATRSPASSSRSTSEPFILGAILLSTLLAAGSGAVFAQGAQGTQPAAQPQDMPAANGAPATAAASAPAVAEPAKGFVFHVDPLVLGVGFVWALVGLPLQIYGTIWALVIAYFTRFVGIGVRHSRAATRKWR